MAEPFWHIHVSYKAPKEPRACDFTWDRGRLFDYPSATMLYEICVEHPMATVLKVGQPLHTEIRMHHLSARQNAGNFVKCFMLCGFAWGTPGLLS